MDSRLRGNDTVGGVAGCEILTLATQPIAPPLQDHGIFTSLWPHATEILPLKERWPP